MMMMMRERGRERFTESFVIEGGIVVTPFWSHCDGTDRAVSHAQNRDLIEMFDQ